MGTFYVRSSKFKVDSEPIAPGIPPGLDSRFSPGPRSCPVLIVDIRIRAKLAFKCMMRTTNRMAQRFRNSTDRLVRNQLNPVFFQPLLEWHVCKVLCIANMTASVRFEEQAPGLESQQCDGVKAAYAFGLHRCVDAAFMERSGLAPCEVFGHGSAQAGQCSAFPFPFPGMMKLPAWESLPTFGFLVGPWPRKPQSVRPPVHHIPGSSCGRTNR